jgi:glycosyltransferase involved in cell wall biosynthesis
MRIGIDGYSLKNRTGIGRYTRELVRALAQEVGPGLVVLHPAGEPWRSAIDARVDRLETRARSRAAWELGARRRLLSGHAFDVFHGPDFCLPRNAATAGVVTIHDVAFLDQPELVAPRARLLYSALARGAARRARRVVCGSTHSAERIAARLGVPPVRLRVVPPGVSAIFAPGDGRAAADKLPPDCRALLRGRRHVLGVGTLEPRKNFAALAEAVARARAAGEDVALVLAGADGRGAREVRRQVARAVGEANAWFGSPGDETLADLYRSAAAVGVVSLYEGFGLPVIEALACGAPVFAVDRGPLAETAAGAAQLAESPESTSIARALLAVLRAPEALRDERRRRGLARADELRWPAIARATLAVYEEAARSD